MINQDNFPKVLSFWNHLTNDFYDWKMRVREIYRVVIGPNQYSQKDLAKLTREKRPALSYNMLFPILLFLVGTQRQSRNQLRAIPAGDDFIDERQADVMTRLLLWNFNKSWFEYEFSKQFIHTIIAGISWGHSSFDFANGHWQYVAHDPLRIMFDRQTTRAGFQNCRFLQDEQYLSDIEVQGLCSDPETLKEIKYRFSFLEPKMNRSAYYEKHYTGVWRWDRNTDRRRAKDYVDYKEGRYVTIDHHEQRDFVVKFFFDSANAKRYVNATTWEDEKIEQFQKQYPDFYYEEIPKKVFWSTKIVPGIDMIIADGPYKVQSGHFNWIPTVAYDIDPFISNSIGAFDNLMQPQDSYNKREATILETLMDGVSASWIVSDKAIKKYIEHWETNERRPYRMYDDRYQAPTKAQQVQPAEGMFRYSDNEAMKIEKISGINASLQGRNQYANESAAMYMRKVEQSAVMLAFLFDNLNYAKTIAVKSAIKHIQYGMTEAQTIRLLNEQGDPYYLPINKPIIDGVLNDVTTGDYDVEIDETQPSTVARRLNYVMALELTRQMPPEVIRWDLIVKSSDFSFKTEWTNSIRSYYKKLGIDIADPAQLLAAPGMAEFKQQQVMQNNPNFMNAIGNGQMVNAATQNMEDYNNNNLIT